MAALTSATAAFSSRVAGAETALTLNLTLSGNLTAGDQLILECPSLTRDWFQPISLAGDVVPALFDAVWSPGDLGALTLPSDPNGPSAVIQLDGAEIRRAATIPLLDADVTLTLGPVGGQDPFAGLWVDARPAPVVVGVYSGQPGAPAVHMAGTLLDISVAFSDTVVLLGGEPSLRLSTGNWAQYASGNGSSVLNFTYAVREGESSLDLACYDTRSLLFLRGGSLLLYTEVQRGLPVVTANLSLAGVPCRRFARRLGTPEPLVVDGRMTANVTQVTTCMPNGTYGAGEVMDILVFFTLPVVVKGTPRLLLSTGPTNTTAPYTRGGRVQSLELAVEPGAAIEVGYRHVSTGCISWNGTAGAGHAVQYALLGTPDEVWRDTGGRPTVRQSTSQKGYTLTFTFSTGWPDPISISTTFCAGNAEVKVAPSDFLTFRLAGPHLSSPRSCLEQLHECFSLSFLPWGAGIQFSKVTGQVTWTTSAPAPWSSEAPTTAFGRLPRGPVPRRT